MNDISLFGAKTVYRVQESDPNSNSKKDLYEERVVVITASSFDDAISKAEIEAESYASETGMRYLEFVNIFKIENNKIEDGTEVYSLMRETELEADAYLNRFFDTGSERTK